MGVDSDQKSAFAHKHRSKRLGRYQKRIFLPPFLCESQNNWFRFKMQESRGPLAVSGFRPSKAETRASEHEKHGPSKAEQNINRDLEASLSFCQGRNSVFEPFSQTVRGQPEAKG
jgi:hypothetical protein